MPAWFMCVAAGLLLYPSPALAQETTGSVVGVVQDTTGAVVPGADVTVTNLDNLSETKTISNGTGEFAISQIPVGLHFRLRVEMSGFASWQSQPFPLRPGDRLNFSDIKMQIAKTSEQVVVEAASSQSIKPLDTPERSDVITAKDLDTLAIEGRDATELIETLPGFAMVSPQVNNQAPNTAVVGMSGPTGSYSPNGAGPTGLATVLDGVSIQDIDTNAGTVQTVNSDMIQEIKATTSTFSAEYAKGPAVLSATTKAGTSSYHGEGYMYFRDTVLNANDWYNNYLQQTRPPGRYLFPGGQLGGPLWIPGTSFGPHNTKLFFFVGYEYYNQNFWAETLGSWVPTMSERVGDFSAASMNAELCGARPDGGVNLDAVLPMCFTDNYLPTGTPVVNGNVASYANSSGAALVNWLPLPNANPFVNEQGYNYVQQVIQTQNGSQLHARVDYNLSDYHLLFATWGRQSQISDDPVAFGYIPNNSMLYPGQVTAGDISNIFSLHYIWRGHSNLTNEASASISFISDPGNMGDPQAVSRFDMNDYNCTNPAKRASATCGNPASDNFNYLGEYKNNYDYSVPALSDYSSSGYPNMLMPGGFYNNQIKMKKLVPTLSDTLDWSKGSHTFAFGAYAERGILNGDADYAAAFPQGEYDFTAGNGYFEYNSGSNGQSGPFFYANYVSCENPDPAGTSRLSGAAYFGSCINPVAMMYMGYSDQFTQTNFSPIVDMQYTSLAGFVNDSWKLHRVTLMLGARVEHLGPWLDRHNNGLATFSPSLYASQCDVRDCNSLAMPGITWHGQNSAISDSVNNPPAIYFSPRVGAAWDIFGSSKTVLRGGWGTYRNQEQFSPYALAGATAQGYKTSQSVGILTFDLVDNQSPINPPDINVTTLSPSDKVRPIYYEFNVAADQRLFKNSLLEVAYVGSESQNLPSYNSQASGYNEASDLNVIPLGGYFAPSFSISSMPASIIEPNTGGSIGSLTTAEQDFYRTYPYYQHIYSLKHNFYSNYNSLQVSWNRSTGLVQWGANYTFSKILATAASYNNNLADPLNLRNDYNPAPFDRTQVFNIHYLVNLGQRYNGGNGFLSKVANGWMVSGISQAYSGPDLPSEEGENFSFGYGNIEPTQVYMPQQVINPGQTETQCANTYNIPPDKNGDTYCLTNMNPIVWLGSPDYLLMPTLSCNPSGGSAKHEFIHAECFGVPLPGSARTGSYALSSNPTGQGQYRLPYIHGPAFLNNNLSLFKDFTVRENGTLELRASSFNFLNHPLVSFNNNDNSNLNLGNLLGAVPGKSLTEAELGYKNFGIANVKYGSRLMELSAKFTF
jgi:Carboxypeptidase regulatory-like domain/TonB-dependent Receptor Plug Domain